MAKGTLDGVLAALPTLPKEELEDVLTAALLQMKLRDAVYLFERWLARSNVGFLQRKKEEKWKKAAFVRRTS